MKPLFIFTLFVFMVSCLTLCYFHKMEVELSKKTGKINDKHEKRVKHLKYGEHH